MKKLTNKQIGQAKPNPVLEGIPDTLKTKKGFKDIETQIIHIMKSDHKHKSVATFNRCKRCKDKVAKKTQFIKDQGFKDLNQYWTYKKVMQIIVNKKELVLHEKR